MVRALFFALFSWKCNKLVNRKRFFTQDVSQTPTTGFMGDQHSSSTTQKVFILAPTPAQLGLTKRISSGMCCNKVLISRKVGFSTYLS